VQKVICCDLTSLGKRSSGLDMLQVMKRIHLAIAIALVSLIAAGSLAMLMVQRPQPAVKSTGTALVGGAFELTSHKGERVTNKNFAGRYMLVFFGYTYCPDVCPAGLQVMTAALDELGTQADPITPVFITIDPERDTPAVLADYVSHFHPRLVGLTGTAAEIAAAATAYRVYYRKAGEDADYLMDHSSILYLMDPKGEFVKHFAYGTDASALAEGIKQALAGE
jgi:protein SCO1/2